MHHFLRGPSDTKAHPLVYFIPPVRRTGGVRLFPHGPKGRGRLEDYSLSWPGGPGRRKTIWGYVPFLAQHWAYGFIPGFMAPFWPPSGLWFRSGSILAHGSVLGFWLRVAQNKDAPARSIPGEASV